MTKPWDEVFGIVREAATIEDVKALFRVKSANATPDELKELEAALRDAEIYFVRQNCMSREMAAH